MIFHSRDISDGLCRLDREESAHCIKVLRHRCGDAIDVIDGKGNFYRCTIVDDSVGGACARIDSVLPDWGGHPYVLTMAVCPTKNIDRYEWFVEKGAEFGLDRIVPVAGDRSERKSVKTERLERLLVSAAKQSLKGTVPDVEEVCSVKDFIRRDSSDLKLICYCSEDENTRRVSIKECLSGKLGDCGISSAYNGAEAVEARVAPDDALKPRISVLVGPEGDFSDEEVALALAGGFIPVHLGPSRLRTETAALAAVCAVYYHFIK